MRCRDATWPTDAPTPTHTCLKAWARVVQHMPPIHNSVYTFRIGHGSFELRKSDTANAADELELHSLEVLHRDDSVGSWKVLRALLQDELWKDANPEGPSKGLSSAGGVGVS